MYTHIYIVYQQQHSLTEKCILKKIFAEAELKQKNISLLDLPGFLKHFWC